MPIVARKTKPKLQKPRPKAVLRVKQPIPAPASPFPVAKAKVARNADHH